MDVKRVASLCSCKLIILAPLANNTAAMLYWEYFNLCAVTSRHESLLCPNPCHFNSISKATSI